jgi:WD40 repeat protein
MESGKPRRNGRGFSFNDGMSHCDSLFDRRRLPCWLSIAFLVFGSSTLIAADDGSVLHRANFKLAAFAVSPDGRRIAISNGHDTVQLIDSASGKEMRTIRTSAHSLAFSADGRSLAMGGNQVVLIEIASGRQLCMLAKGDEPIRSIAFRADGAALATGTPHGGARLWNIPDGKQLAAFDLGHWGVTRVAVSPNSKILVAAGAAMINPPPPGLPVPKKFVAWDAESKKPIFEGPWPSVGGSLLISPDGKTLAVAAEGGLDLWDLEARNMRARIRGHHDFPQSAGFSTDGKLIATGDEHGMIRLWDTVTGRAHAFIRKSTGAIRGLAFVGIGKKLLSAEIANGATILRTWDATDDSSHYLYMPLPNECFALSVSADGTRVFAATDSGISRWNLKTGQELPRLVEQKFGLDGAAFSRDGKIVATLDRTSEVRLWNADAGKVRLRRPKTGKFAAAFSADGSLLAVADFNVATVLKTADGKEQFTLGGHRKQITGIAFSPDGKTIITVSQDKNVRWWDATTGKPEATELHGSSLACVAISPDGKMVASGAEDGTIKVWDLNTREIIATLGGPEKTVRCLAFSPDGKSLASGSADGACRIWDIAEQKAQVAIADAGGPVGIAYMPDGKTILTAGISKAIHLWDPKTGAEKLKP